MTRRKHLSVTDLSGRDIGAVVQVGGRRYRVLFVIQRAHSTCLGVIFMDGDTAVRTEASWPTGTPARRMKGHEPIDGLPRDVAEWRALAR